MRHRPRANDASALPPPSACGQLIALRAARSDFRPLRLLALAKHDTSAQWGRGAQRHAWSQGSLYVYAYAGRQLQARGPSPCQQDHGALQDLIESMTDVLSDQQ